MELIMEIKTSNAFTLYILSVTSSLHVQGYHAPIRQQLVIN